MKTIKHLIVALITLSATGTVGLAWTQLKPPPRDKLPLPALDRVQTTSISVDKVRPTLTETVRVGATIKNLDPNYTLTVPWKIVTNTGDLVGSGTRQNVPPASTFDISANWTPRAGTYTFWAIAD